MKCKFLFLDFHLIGDPSIVYVCRDPRVNAAFFTLCRPVASDSNLDAVDNNWASTISLKDDTTNISKWSTHACRK